MDDPVEANGSISAKYSSPYYAKDAVIYFLAAGDPPHAIKIGMTGRNELKRRITSIQSANHERIRLVKAIEVLGGDKPALRAEKMERELHIQFASLQRAKKGTVGSEWFDYKEPLISFMETLDSLPEDLLIYR